MKKFFYTILLIACMPIVLLSEDLRLFRTVHFKGLKTLTKYDIAKKAGMKSHNNMIAVDLERLEAVLADEPVVEKFSIDDKNDILTIEVAEYSPEYVVYITGRRSNIFCEVDKDFHIISAKRLHVSKFPVIVIDVTGVDDKKIKDEQQTLIKNFMKQMEESPLKGQLKQLDFSSAGSVGILLAGRRTEFVVSAINPELDRLKTAVGYLDAIERYPARLDIRGRMAVIR